jgi:hypothetical protein
LLAGHPEKLANHPGRKNLHGLICDQRHRNLLVAGGNGKVILLNDSTGTVLSSLDIAPKVDPIAADEESWVCLLPS